MKKSLLALAVMGAFAGAAHAQSSVTVYGVLDASYSAIESNSTTTAGVKTTAKVRNTVNGDGALATSRLGLRGVEDLGGGLSAQFVLEWDLINIGNGATGDGATQAATATAGATTSTGRGFGPRYSYIGIASKNFGTLRLGRQETSIHGVIAGNLAGAANNVLGSLYSGLDSTYQLTTAQAPTVRPHNVFIDNAYTFISNNMGGVVVQLQTAQNAYSASQTTASAGVQASGGSITYTGIKNLQIAAGMIVEGTTTASVSNIRRNTRAVGANYDFNVARLFVLHTQNKVENLNLTSSNLLSDTKLTEVGVRAPVSKVVNIFGSYFTGSRSNNSGATALGVAIGTTAAGAADAKGFQLGTTYAFSKRTTAYGIYGTQELKGVGAATGAKLDGSMYALGLRHTF
ncbi:MAG: porin [Betaproteobacteria bacterium]|nr:porin [Betaproteobacteria bacterium]